MLLRQGDAHFDWPSIDQCMGPSWDFWGLMARKGMSRKRPFWGSRAPQPE